MNIKLMAKKLFTSKLFYIIIAVLTIIFLLFILIKSRATITDAERISLDEFANRAMTYMEEVDFTSDYETEKTDNYIVYAVEYNFGENGKTETTVDEIAQLTKEIFDFDIDKKEIRHRANSSRTINKYIGYDEAKSTFILNRQFFDNKLAAVKPIDVYFEKTAHKSGGNFIVTYEKFQFDTPYDIRDCAAERNISISDFDKYLNGSASSANLKRAAVKECTNTSGNYLKDLTVTYSIKDGHLYIKTLE